MLFLIFLLELSPLYANSKIKAAESQKNILQPSKSLVAKRDRGQRTSIKQWYAADFGRIITENEFSRVSMTIWLAR